MKIQPLYKVLLLCTHPHAHTPTHIHTHGGTADALQMVSSLAKQHTYAGYNSAKSSTLRPGRTLKVCSQLTNIYREITHLHSKSSHRWWNRISVQGKQKRIRPLILSAALCLFIDIGKRRSEVTEDRRDCFLLRATRAFELFAVKVFQVI